MTENTARTDRSLLHVPRMRPAHDAPARCSGSTDSLPQVAVNKIVGRGGCVGQRLPPPPPRSRGSPGSARAGKVQARRMAGPPRPAAAANRATPGRWRRAERISSGAISVLVWLCRPLIPAPAGGLGRIFCAPGELGRLWPGLCRNSLRRAIFGTPLSQPLLAKRGTVKPRKPCRS